MGLKKQVHLVLGQNWSCKQLFDQSSCTIFLLQLNHFDSVQTTNERTPGMYFCRNWFMAIMMMCSFEFPHLSCTQGRVVYCFVGKISLVQASINVCLSTLNHPPLNSPLHQRCSDVVSKLWSKRSWLQWIIKKSDFFPFHKINLFSSRLVIFTFPSNTIALALA